MNLKNIDKTAVINILQKNFGFKKIVLPIGDAIIMNSYDAFIYSTVTGSPYLNNEFYPLSLSGLMKIFNSAFSPSFITGLYQNSNLHYTPDYFKYKIDNIDVGKKYIVPIEIESEKDYLKQVREIKLQCLKSDINYHSILLQRIEKFKNGYGMEPFLEYITSKYFSLRGYVVENQFPLSHSLGSPDFGGFKVSKAPIYINNKFNQDKGFNIIELAMARMFGSKIELKKIEPSEFIVGEAKTSTTIMEDQLFKYYNTGLFRFAFEIHPFKPESSNELFGLINIKSNYLLNVQFPTVSYNSSDNYSRNHYEDWLVDYFKLYLLANLTEPDELTNFSKNKKISLDNNEKLVQLIKNTSFNELANYINNEGEI